jgi:putative transposase
VPLGTYNLFAGEDQLTAVVMARMLAGLATRRHPTAAEPAGAAVEQQTSATSATVARHLLADLVGRGLDFDDGLLVVIDGAKALSSAVTSVFGAKAAIQRCTLHKRRNAAEHLPESERDWVDLKLVRALNNPDAAAGLRDAKALATALERKHPRRRRVAARRHGATVHSHPPGHHRHAGQDADHLEPDRVDDLNCPTNRNVTRWRDGQMVLRWTAAGMLNAQQSFRRVKGYKQMPQLVAALRPTRPPHPGAVQSASFAADGRTGRRP